MTDNSLEYGISSRYWIAIVGMGAGGARLFTSMIDRVCSNDRLASSVGFILVDQRPVEEFGRGIAWSSSQSEVFLANMRLPTMGLKADVLARVRTQLGVEDWNQDQLPEGFQFQVRKIIGQALHEDFKAHVKEAEEKDIPIVILSDLVTDIAADGRGWAVLTKKTRGRYADFVVLALGNVPSSSFPSLANHKNFVQNPWRWDDYADKLEGSRVGVIGLGPTGVDAILFANEKRAQHIVAASRSGKLQYPRPKNDPKVPYHLHYLSEEAVRIQYDLKKANVGRGLSFEELHFMIRMEFDDAKACEELKVARTNWAQNSARDMLYSGLKDANKIQLWYSVMKSIDAATPFIWNSLNAEGRRKYKTSLQTEHQSLSFGMAYKHANTLVDLLDQKNKLVIGSCTADPPQQNPDGTFSWKVNDDEHVLDVIINCSGIGSSPEDFEHIGVLKSLTDRGWLLPHPDGGFWVDFMTGQVFKRPEGREKLGEMYCLIGSLTRGTHLLTNCLGQLFAFSDRTAQHIIEKIAAAIPSGREKTDVALPSSLK